MSLGKSLQLKYELDSLRFNIQQLRADLHSFFLDRKEESGQDFFSKDEGQCHKSNEVNFDLAPKP